VLAPFAIRARFTLPSMPRVAQKVSASVNQLVTTTDALWSPSTRALPFALHHDLAQI